jgi:hypothetical protein
MYRNTPWSLMRVCVVAVGSRVGEGLVVGHKVSLGDECTIFAELLGVSLDVSIPTGTCI